MSKLPTLAIVVILAIGRCGSVLCDVWCASDDRAQECHVTLASVVAAGCCDGPVASRSGVVGSQSRHETVSLSLQAGERHGLVKETLASAGLIRRDGPHGSHPNSLLTVLRI